VGEEAFSVVREAMSKSNTRAISRVVLYHRERAVLLEPRNKGVVLWTLWYGAEVRDEAEYFKGIKGKPVPKGSWSLCVRAFLDARYAPTGRTIRRCCETCRRHRPAGHHITTISIEFPPATAVPARPRPHLSTGTKIVWRGLSPDDLVMWPLPVVSSTSTISPAPMWRVSPSLAVIEIPPARLITYCRRGARCQLFS